MKSILFIFLYLPSLAFACSCLRFDLDKSMQDAEYIYIGNIIESKLMVSGKVLNQLEVVSLLKGEPDKLELLSTTFERTMCARPTSVGKKYVVFGKVGEVPSISACTATQPMDFYKSESMSILKSIANK